MPLYYLFIMSKFDIVIIVHVCTIRFFHDPITFNTEALRMGSFKVKGASYVEMGLESVPLQSDHVATNQSRNHHFSPRWVEWWLRLRFVATCSN